VVTAELLQISVDDVDRVAEIELLHELFRVACGELGVELPVPVCRAVIAGTRMPAMPRAVSTIMRDHMLVFLSIYGAI